MTATPTERIYFSDFFGISPELLEEYGAFDISLINDLPLFIDPFLLFNSGKVEYRGLHDGIIKYLRFLRDKSIAGVIDDGLLEAWFTFREVKENWFGYSLNGNEGTGLGMTFARALNADLANIFQHFGDEDVTKSSHIEKVCLVGDGVGRDNISDFATNLIKDFLLEYTQEFARKRLQPPQRTVFAVPRTAFNYETETWETRTYELPAIDGRFVILTPIDLLTKDEIWINKTDLVDDFARVADAIPNEQLRAQINNYFALQLSEIQSRDQKRKKERRASRVTSTRPSRRRRRKPAPPPAPTKKQLEEAAVSAIRQFPAFIDYFIRWKEDHGDEAEQQADERVRSSAKLYIAQVRALVDRLTALTGFYGVSGNTKEEARTRVMFLKDVIENKGGWRIFYDDNKPIRRESDLHILFRLTWCNTPSDVNREVNNGRGPSDFEVSRGRFDKSIVEFKLAKNTGLEKNLQHQAEIYKRASDAQHALKVIVFFAQGERDKVRAILTALNLDKNDDIILIDGRDDNKPSASKADAQLS